MSAPSVRPRRLVNFDEGLRLIRAHVGPCTPTTLPVAEALGAVLAEPAIVPADLPPQPMALRDGFAVSADTLIGASPNLPLPLATDARFVNSGETLPTGMDAVLPREDVIEEHADGDWYVRPITGSSSTKVYRCPGCDHEIVPATPHIVAWPVHAGSDERRHWHSPCWRARSTSSSTGSSSPTRSRTPASASMGRSRSTRLR